MAAYGDVTPPKKQVYNAIANTVVNALQKIRPFYRMQSFWENTHDMFTKLMENYWSKKIIKYGLLRFFIAIYFGYNGNYNSEMTLQKKYWNKNFVENHPKPRLFIAVLWKKNY